MRLFHGSNMMIDKVDLSKSKLYKDFGQAFYLSAERNQAQKMAEAFDKVYNSHTYESLLNSKSQLYYQSPGYVYACLCAEA